MDSMDQQCNNNVHSIVEEMKKMFEEPSNGIHGPPAKAARKIAWDDAVTGSNQ